MNPTDPSTWEAPTWHPDFGDPAIEVTMLREFCIRAKKMIPTIATEILFPEQGYLNVDVRKNDRKVAEIHVVPTDGERNFGLFGFDGELETDDEYYFSDHYEGIQLLQKLIG